MDFDWHLHFGSSSLEIVSSRPFRQACLPEGIQKEATTMAELKKPAFDAAAFLMSAGLGRRIVQVAAKQTFFSQGDLADSVFYLQKGRAKVTVVSQAGKEATSRCSPRAILWERARWRQCLGCVCLRPPPLPPAPRSRLRGKR
jgi:CRP-like cAMP-binding protein